MEDGIVGLAAHFWRKDILKMSWLKCLMERKVLKEQGVD
jgi:hypothetical protein